MEPQKMVQEGVKQNVLPNKSEQTTKQKMRGEEGEPVLPGGFRREKQSKKQPFYRLTRRKKQGKGGKMCRIP